MEKKKKKKLFLYLLCSLQLALEVIQHMLGNLIKACLYDFAVIPDCPNTYGLYFTASSFTWLLPRYPGTVTGIKYSTILMATIRVLHFQNCSVLASSFWDPGTAENILGHSSGFVRTRRPEGSQKLLKACSGWPSVHPGWTFVHSDSPINPRRKSMAKGGQRLVKTTLERRRKWDRCD